MDGGRPERMGQHCIVIEDMGGICVEHDHAGLRGRSLWGTVKNLEQSSR